MENIPREDAEGESDGETCNGLPCTRRFIIGCNPLYVMTPDEETLLSILEDYPILQTQARIGVIPMTCGEYGVQIQLRSNVRNWADLEPIIQYCLEENWFRLVSPGYIKLHSK